MKVVRRRDFLLSASAFLAVPLSSFAQQSKKVRRIGYLHLGTSAMAGRAQQQFRDSLRRAGYEEGGNLVIEKRFADGKVERLPELANELVGLKVELIVCILNPPIEAAKRATSTIPIVMHVAGEPIENGYIESLARPGGNITGTTWAGPEQAAKLLDVLKQAVPGVVRIASMSNPAHPGGKTWATEIDRAAGVLGMQVQHLLVTRAEDVRVALDRVAETRPDALVVLSEIILISRAREIAEFATQRKLVSIAASPRHVELGGLMYYGPDLAAIYERTAGFVDRILRGARPADLPVELPTKYELVINTKAAQIIGFKPLQSFAQRVDRTIE